MERTKATTTRCWRIGNFCPNKLLTGIHICIENIIQPEGDSHWFPDRPLPFNCLFAWTISPSCFTALKLTSVKTVCVELIISVYTIFRPYFFVFSLSWYNLGWKEFDSNSPPVMIKKSLLLIWSVWAYSSKVWLKTSLMPLPITQLELQPSFSWNIWSYLKVTEIKLYQTQKL